MPRPSQRTEISQRSPFDCRRAELLLRGAAGYWRQEHWHPQHCQPKNRPIFRRGCGFSVRTRKPGGAGGREHDRLRGNRRAQYQDAADRRALSHAARDQQRHYYEPGRAGPAARYFRRLASGYLLRSLCPNPVPGGKQYLPFPRCGGGTAVGLFPSGSGGKPRPDLCRVGVRPSAASAAGQS